MDHPTPLPPLNLMANDIRSALSQLDGPPRRPMVKLSSLLGELHISERLEPIAQLEQALQDGTITSVSIDERMEVRYLDAAGTVSKHKAADELMHDTPDLRAWLATMARESIYTHLSNGLPIKVTPEHISSGQLDYDRLAAIRRAVAARRIADATLPQEEKATKMRSKHRSKAGTRTPEPDSGKTDR